MCVYEIRVIFPHATMLGAKSRRIPAIALTWRLPTRGGSLTPTQKSIPTVHLSTGSGIATHHFRLGLSNGTCPPKGEKRSAVAPPLAGLGGLSLAKKGEKVGGTGGEPSNGTEHGP